MWLVNMFGCICLALTQPCQPSPLPGSHTPIHLLGQPSQAESCGCMPCRSFHKFQCLPCPLSGFFWGLLHQLPRQPSCYRLRLFEKKGTAGISPFAYPFASLFPLPARLAFKAALFVNRPFSMAAPWPCNTRAPHFSIPGNAPPGHLQKKCQRLME